MTTPKLGLTELANGQQNYLNANETFNQIDQIMQLFVNDKDLTAPPVSPADGDAYIVASPATGLWAGRENDIAYWLDSTQLWQFVTPRFGWMAAVDDENIYYWFKDGSWQVLPLGTSLLSPIEPAGTTYTLDGTENGKMITFNTASDGVISIPDGLTPGLNITTCNIGTGSVTFSMTGADILNGVALMADTAGAMGLQKVNSNNWQSTERI